MNIHTYTRPYEASKALHQDFVQILDGVWDLAV